MEKKEISLRELYNQIPDDIFEMVSEILSFLKEFEKEENIEVNELERS